MCCVEQMKKVSAANASWWGAAAAASGLAATDGGFVVAAAAEGATVYGRTHGKPQRRARLPLCRVAAGSTRDDSQQSRCSVQKR